MNEQHPILLFVILALLATAPFSSAQAQQPSEEQVARILKRFPEADKDKDGKLSTEEIEAVRQRFQSRQRNRTRGKPSAGEPFAGSRFGRTGPRRAGSRRIPGWCVGA